MDQLDYFFQLAGSLRQSWSSSTSSCAMYPVSQSLGYNVLIVGKSYQLDTSIGKCFLGNREPVSVACHHADNLVSVLSESLYGFE